MGFPLQVALRYMGSRQRAFVSLGTALAVLGVALGTACLSIVVSVTGGFRAEFREKVLGVNAHVLVLRHSSDFREYRKVMDDMRQIPGVIGVAPFVINPMMVSHGSKTATGVLLKGVDPKLFGEVLDLPKHIVEGGTEGLRAEGAKPPESTRRLRLRESVLTGPTQQNHVKVDGIDSARAGAAALDEVTRGLDGAPSGAPSAPPPPSNPGAALDLEHLPEGVPQGDVEPDGGYESTLPDPDDIPEELDEDPCRSPEAVKALPGIIIGKSLREYLGADIGSCLQVTSPTVGYSFSSGSFRPPVAKRFRVIAVFDAGFDQYDSKLVYTDLYESQAFHQNGDSVTGVELKVARIDDSQAIKALVNAQLDSPVYNTMDWMELNRGLFTALQIQQITISMVLALMILVAAFTVLATLIMVVLDKRREIAVMKAMGATDFSLVRAFLYQGGIIGLFGASLGLGLGYLCCLILVKYPFPLDPKVYFISYLPVQLDGWWFLAAGAFSLIVCLAGSLWPAVHAARLRPAEAFRGQ